MSGSVGIEADSWSSDDDLYSLTDFNQGECFRSGMAEATSNAVTDFGLDAHEATTTGRS
ncbi:hypothetical protein PUNSTDRAFT_53142 [Punctularia strigosozonata HHB-11173 SS5]|uniref:uncharacterized protein n=1 Tax=Punctularia strigosozonata (strain HHB-11173) TaxID=741275 RepID=UPI0004416473|nr:uncharacterized protein PUNSTDRAFT_53142 [Punctularia strigosozonata HHB-11173 SS5]EIN07777.1 hypothetical protein PUNSTDRAFT_53142 [Punctularia strigosozonata HHB-11173 SS5]